MRCPSPLPELVAMDRIDVVHVQPTESTIKVETSTDLSYLDNLALPLPGRDPFDCATPSVAGTEVCLLLDLLHC